MFQFCNFRTRLLTLSAMVAIQPTCPIAFAEGENSGKVIAGAPAPLTAGEGTKYELRYKLSIGDVLRYEVTHRASIQSTIEQSTQAAQTKTDSVKAWKVSDVLPNGEIEFMNVVERVSMVNQLPDRDPVEFDSARDTSPPPGFEDAAKAINVPLSVIRMSPQGEVKRRDVNLGHLRVDEDAPTVVRLPKEPVAVGATWDERYEVKVELPGGATRQVQTRRLHKLSKVDGDVATIEVTYQVLSPVDPTQEAQLVQRMMSGEVQFKLSTGRIVAQKMDIDKRILGFAGPTSSMQYIMRMEEKLLEPNKKLATQPPVPRPGMPETAGTATSSAKPPKQSSPQPPARAAAGPRRPARSNRSATRPRQAPQGARGYVR